LKNPIEKFRRVGISPDLHLAEREEIRKMVNEAKQAHIASEEEDVGNYKFLVVAKGSSMEGDKDQKEQLFLAGISTNIITSDSPSSNTDDISLSCMYINVELS